MIKRSKFLESYIRNQSSSALICVCVRVCLCVCSCAVVVSEALPDIVVLACCITVGSDHRAHYLFIVSSRHGDCGNHTERRGAGAPCRHTLCRPYPWVPEERYMYTVTCGGTETTESLCRPSRKALLLQCRHLWRKSIWQRSLSGAWWLRQLSCDVSRCIDSVQFCTSGTCSSLRQIYHVYG